METTIRQHGWDGEWFLRAYDDFGNKVGSKENEEGKIFIETQGFCTLAGVGLDDGLADRRWNPRANISPPSMASFCSNRPIRSTTLNLGEISSYPPGYKENAGIFCHNNPWVMIGEARVGNGDAALITTRASILQPARRSAIVHRCEPYVYAQMIAGRDAPTHGEAKNSWLTGTAAWNYYAITQWILGIRSWYDGLQIAPVVPKGWRGFKATRKFRGVTYNVAVERTGPGNQICSTSRWMHCDRQPCAVAWWLQNAVKRIAKADSPP